MQQIQKRSNPSGIAPFFNKVYVLCVSNGEKLVKLFFHHYLTESLRLCLTFWQTKRSSSAAFSLRFSSRNIDCAVSLLIFVHVVLQSKEQTLGMFRSEDDAALHVSLGNARQHADEIHNHLSA